MLPTAGVLAQRAAVVNALQSLPAEMEVAVIVPDLSALAGDLVLLNGSAALELEGLRDLSGQFTRSLGLYEGIDRSGPWVLSLSGLGPWLNGESERPEALMLIGAENHEALVEGVALGKPDAEGAVPVAIPGGFKGVARPIESMMLFAPDAESAKRYAPGQSAEAWSSALGTGGVKAMDQADVFVLIDLAWARTNADAALAGVDAAIREMDPMSAEPIRQALAYYRALGEPVLRSAEAMVLAVDLGDHGLSIIKAMPIQAGSPLASMLPTELQDAGAGQRDGLASLPAQPYLYALSTNTAKLNLGPTLDRLEQTLSPMAKEALDLRAVRQLLSDAGQIGSAFYAPSDPQAMLASGPFNAVTVYETLQPQRVRTLLKQRLQALAEQIVPMGPTEAARFDVSLQPDAQIVGGTAIDQYRITLQLPESLIRGFNPLAMAFANSGLSGYLAATDNRVVLTGSTNLQLLRDTLATMKDGGGLGTTGSTEAVRREAFDRPLLAEAYLGLEGLGITLESFLPMFAPNLRLPNAQGVPPLALGVMRTDDGVQGKVVLPAASLAYLAEVARVVQDALQPTP